VLVLVLVEQQPQYYRFVFVSSEEETPWWLFVTKSLLFATVQDKYKQYTRDVSHRDGSSVILFRSRTEFRGWVFINRVVALVRRRKTSSLVYLFYGWA
jgi:hypothetical protein